MSLIIRRATLLILSGLALGSLLRAEAQPGGGHTFHSLEARIAEARTVFCATVTNLQETVVHTNINGRAYDSFNYRVALRISEVFKGSLSNRCCEFDVNHVAEWPELRSWAANHVPFLWFLDRDETELAEDFHSHPTLNLIALCPKLECGLNDRVYGEDMTIVTEPREVLRRARAFSKKRLVVTKFHDVWLADLSSRAYFNLRVMVPVDPSLERTAKRLLTVPDEFISQTNNHVITGKTEAEVLADWRCEYRAEGVSALQYFKSGPNIKLLKSLLDDPAYWETRYPPGVTNMVNRIYAVRQNAYDVLRGWGVEAPKPVTSEIVPASAKVREG